MPEHKPTPGSILIRIDPAGGTNYTTLVCLTSVGDSRTRNVIDAASACGPDKLPGIADYSFTGEGQHLQDPDTGKMSGTSLKQLFDASTNFSFRIGPLSPIDGDEIETGTGFISDLSSTYAFDGAATFSLTIQPKGKPNLMVYSS